LLNLQILYHSNPLFLILLIFKLLKCVLIMITLAFFNSFLFILIFYYLVNVFVFIFNHFILLLINFLFVNFNFIFLNFLIFHHQKIRYHRYHLYHYQMILFKNNHYDTQYLLYPDLIYLLLKHYPKYN